MKFMKVFCCLLNNFWCDSFDSFIGAEPLDVRLRNVLLRSEILLSRSEKCCIMCYLRARWPRNMMGFEFLTMLNHVHDDVGVLFVDCSVDGCSCLIKMKNHHFWMPTKALHTSSSIRWYIRNTFVGKRFQMNINIRNPQRSLDAIFCVFLVPPFWELWHMWKAWQLPSHFTSFYPIASIWWKYGCFRK